MSKLIKMLESINYRRVTLIFAILLVITLIIATVYLKNRKETFATIAETNLKSKLINQFNECFDGQAITLDSTDLETLNIVDNNPPTNYDDVSKYYFFNANINIFISIKDNILLKLTIYLSGLKSRLINGYCVNVKKDVSTRNYNDFDNIFKTELKNLYTIILCCIKKYKKLYLFKKSTNETYASISGDLTTEENIDLKNQLHCMIRLMVQIDNQFQSIHRAAEECVILIENFSKSTSCNAVEFANPDVTCYSICGKNLNTDDRHLYGMVPAPQPQSCNVQTLPTFSPVGINVINKSSSPATSMNGYTINSNSYSFSGPDTLIIQGLNNLPTSAPTGTPSPASSGTPAPASSGTPSPASSGTPSPTLSGTPSPTLSGTPSPTLSGTPSPTLSETPSPTLSETPSPTLSETPSPTLSGTPAPASSERTEPPASYGLPGTSNNSSTYNTQTYGSGTSTDTTNRHYHHHPMTVPYDIPEMPGPFLPLYSDTYPSNALRDDPYASFNNTDYYIKYNQNPDQGIDINLENNEGNNNFFMPKIILDEE
jgi:hypothetical protein